MSTPSVEELSDMNERIETDATHNEEPGVCNWCGTDASNLETTRTNVMVSDIPRTLKECTKCGEVTAVYNWNGVQWRAAIHQDGYVLISGASSQN